MRYSLFFFLLMGVLFIDNIKSCFIGIVFDIGCKLRFEMCLLRVLWGDNFVGLCGDNGII